VQDFKAAAIRLLERFAQDASQSARKRESWARIAQVVDETEPDKAAAVADAIVSAVGAEHADKLGEGGLSFIIPPLYCDLVEEAFF
jgi:ATP-dependent Lon protease